VKPQNNNLDHCQEILGYQFINKDILVLALTHSSVAPTRSQSNERMEFLGDAILGMTVCCELYETYPESLEGEMTRVKSLVVSRQICAEITEEMHLSDFLHLGKGMGNQVGLPTSVSAAVLESVIGAIYLDGGVEPARQFILKHIRPHIESAMASEHQQNYKAMLQQHVQQQWGTTPIYYLLDEKGPDHNKCFEVGVSVGGKHFPSAWGQCKKDAEQKAAYQALQKMGIEE